MNAGAPNTGTEEPILYAVLIQDAWVEETGLVVILSYDSDEDYESKDYFDLTAKVCLGVGGSNWGIQYAAPEVDLPFWDRCLEQARCEWGMLAGRVPLSASDASRIMARALNAYNRGKGRPEEMRPSTILDNSQIKERTTSALAKLKPVDNQRIASENMLFTAKKTKAGCNLPEPYLVYFLLVDFLGYKDLGQREKVLYSIPVDFNGTAYLVEYRKSGLGLFAADPETQEDDATTIVKLINQAVEIAQPYFEHRANDAAEGSKLNLKNQSHALYDRYIFFRKNFLEKQKEIENRKDERKVEKEVGENGLAKWPTFRTPVFELNREARWLGLAAVEAFYSWTEHVFIHVAVLKGKCKTGKEVAKLCSANWREKFKAALNIEESGMKDLYDKLLAIRQQLRNYISHGAFGKDREAFSFHSSIGAVPLCLPHTRKQQPFRFGSGVDLDPTQAFDVFEHFESHLWNDWRGVAKLYIQDSGLPTILSMAADGTYDRVRSSKKEMLTFIEGLAKQFDDALNMDW